VGTPDGFQLPEVCQDESIAPVHILSCALSEILPLKTMIKIKKEVNRNIIFIPKVITSQSTHKMI
jgi:hypothetical protein